MTTASRYQFHRTLTAAQRLEEFARQDRFERRLTWFSLTLGALAVTGWIVALLPGLPF